MNTVEVSVIVPMYNQVNNLRSLINNLSSQSMASSEFILIDDGSTDNTYQTARNLTRGDHRFKVYTQHNSGTGSARNFGIHHAKGKYLFFLDADDAIAENNTLEELCATANRYEMAICGGSIMFKKRGRAYLGHDGFGDISDSFKLFLNTTDIRDEPYMYFIENNIYRYMDYQYDLGFTRFVYLRSLLVDNNILFPERPYFEDPVFLTRALDAAGKFCSIPKTTYIYNIGWHPAIHDTRYFVETMRGIRQNLIFSRERGYRKLHRITCNRFRQCNNIDLVLSDENIDELSNAAYEMWEAFDPNYAEEGNSVVVPRCLAAVNSYGSASWYSMSARLDRAKRKTREEIAGFVKGSRAARVAEMVSGRRYG